ncbi:hypothetical protein [Oceanobacillus alkalisoli]|uniref:hypothetical protein n=1 Tax=Oceanobacillus alkalisoli TaxID=2925113 RepID=UPI0034E2E0D6
MSIIVPGRMYAEEYDKRGLKSKNLSQTLEDAGTMNLLLYHGILAGHSWQPH